MELEHIHSMLKTIKTDTFLVRNYIINLFNSKYNEVVVVDNTEFLLSLKIIKRGSEEDKWSKVEIFVDISICNGELFAFIFDDPDTYVFDEMDMFETIESLVDKVDETLEETVKKYEAFNEED